MADGKVIIEIDGDPSKLEQAFDKVGDKISDIGSSMTKSITIPVLAAGTAAVKFASDYEENLNKVDVAFAESAEQVKAWATTATEQFGMSESAALEATALFGDMGTSMGLTSTEAANMSVSLAGLAGDLASFKNIGIDEAMTALKGVFTGETESLKMLGVVMTETNLKEFAKGLGLVYDEMNQAQKVTLRYKYVLAQTENAQGDYIRTADGTANSVRTLMSSVENLGAAFGEELLPTITPIIQDTTELIKKFGDMDDSTKTMIIRAGVFVAAIGPAASAVGKLTSAAGKASESIRSLSNLFNGGTVSLTAMAGPAVVASAAIAGVTTALVFAIKEATKMDEATKALNDSLASTIEIANTSRQEIDTSTTAALNLVAQVETLVATENKSAAEKERLKTLVSTLNQLVPELGASYDDLTGSINMSTEEMRDFILESARIKAVESMQEELSELYRLQAEALGNLNDKKAAAEAADIAYLDAISALDEQLQRNEINMTQYALASAKLRAEHGRAKKAADDAQSAYDDATNAVSDAEAVLTDYAGSLDGAVEATEDLTKSTEDSTDALTDEAEAAAEATKAMGKIGTAAYDAMRSGGNLQETYEDLRREMDGLTGSGDPYIESLAEQALYMLDVAATAQELETTYGDLTDAVWASSTQMAADLVTVGMSADDFAAGCESMRDRVINSFETIQVNEELTAQQIAENLANNLAVHNEWSSNLIGLWNSTQDETVRAFILYMYDQGPEYALAVSQWANGGAEALASSAESWAAIGDSTVAGYYARVAGEASLSEATASGGQVTDSVAVGMENEIPAAEAAAEAATAAVVEVWDTASSSFQTAGTTAGQKINEGLASQQSAITTTATTTASAVETSFTDPYWYGVGYDVSSGIASGISGGSYLITNAATAAAWAAYYAAKSALDINSPSKLMEDDIGYQSAAGVAVGWKKGAKEIVNEVEASADLMHSTAQIAMRPSSISSDYQTLYSSAARSILGNGKGGVIVIEVPLAIDGREFSRVTARYTSDQLEFLEV